jgi:hypothetical protein
MGSKSCISLQLLQGHKQRLHAMHSNPWLGTQQVAEPNGDSPDDG